MKKIYKLDTTFSNSEAFAYLLGKYDDKILFDDDDYTTTDHSIYEVFENANFSSCCFESGLDPDSGEYCDKCNQEYYYDLTNDEDF